MKITNFIILCAVFGTCLHGIRADDDVEVIDVEDDGSVTTSGNAVPAEEDLLPAYYNEIGLEFLNGAELRARVSNGGRRGITAARDIEPNSEVMRIPVSTIISMGGIQQYPDLTTAMTNLQVSTTVGLAVLLTYERYHVGEASKYHKYPRVVTKRIWYSSILARGRVENFGWLTIIGGSADSCACYTRRLQSLESCALLRRFPSNDGGRIFI